MRGAQVFLVSDPREHLQSKISIREATWECFTAFPPLKAMVLINNIAKRPSLADGGDTGWRKTEERETSSLCTNPAGTEATSQGGAAAE